MNGVAYTGMIRDEAVKRAAQALVAGLPPAINAINDLEIRRVIEALDAKKRRGLNESIPSIHAIRDTETRRVLQQIHNAT